MCENMDRDTFESGVNSKLKRPIVLKRKLSIVVHLFSPGYGKRLLDPSGLLPDLNLSFRVPGHPPCCVTCLNPFDQLTLTFNGVYTSVKRTHHHFRKNVSLINFGKKVLHNQKHRRLFPFRLMTLKI